MLISISARFAVKGFVLALPFLLALIVVAGISDWTILVFYLLISLEGIGILYWAISNLRMEQVSRSFKTPSRAYSYPHRNRAEAIVSFVRSGSKQESYTRHVCRLELSRIVGDIVEQTPASSKGADDEPTIDSTELNFILNPPDRFKASPYSTPDLDYVASLEHVVSKLQARWY